MSKSQNSKINDWSFSIIDKFNFYLYRYFLKGVSAKIIVSTGRTGTKFFVGLLELLDPGAIIYHEPVPDYFDLGVDKFRNKRSFNYLVRYMIKSRGSLLFGKFTLIKRIFGLKIIYIESNPFLFPLIPEFISIFRNCEIIYISRDPSTYLISAYNKDPQNDGLSNFYGESDLRKRLTAIDFNEMDYLEWNLLTRIEKIAWYWNKCNKMLFLEYKQHKEQSILIKFEDIFSFNQNTRIEALKALSYFLKSDKILESKKKEILALLNNKINNSKNLTNISSLNNFDDKTRMKIQGLTNEMAGYLLYK